MKVSTKQPYTLFNNSRFYILVSSILLSVLIVGWLRMAIPSDQLFVIRTQQLFGLLCLVYWYTALIISPIGHIIGKSRMKHIEFARRAIGVSAFYFALLHGSIVLWGQLGGIEQLQYLPTLFQWSLLAGAIAFVILGSMAATSFDVVVKFMTYRKWKLLHRLVYIAFILVVLHIWSLGTHLAYGEIQLVGFVALAFLGALELYGITRVLNEKYLHLNKAEVFAMFLTVWACFIVLVLLMPTFVQNYHSRHADHAGTSHSEEARQ